MPSPDGSIGGRILIVPRFPPPPREHVDNRLLNFLNDHRIPLEVCLRSNLQTRAVKSMASHPFRFYLDLGLRVTLNTDNRLITDTTVTSEYLLAANQWDLSADELGWVMINGFKSAFMPFRDKKMLMRRVVREYEELVSGLPADKPKSSKRKKRTAQHSA